jgi:hypothetical protein
MTRITILLFLLIVCITAASQAQAQAPAPKPDPALKKLHVWAGHWSYEGEYKAGPLGPGGKASGERTGDMILGGFFFQGRWTQKGPVGEGRVLEITGYDPVNKNFSSEFYMSDGSRASAVLTVSRNTFTWAGKGVIAGKQCQFKETLVLAADLTSMTDTAEISADGKTWTPLFERKHTKVKPAPKK